MRRPPAGAGPLRTGGSQAGEGQVHDDRDVFQGRIDELPAIDIHSL